MERCNIKMQKVRKETPEVGRLNLRQLCREAKSLETMLKIMMWSLL